MPDVISAIEKILALWHDPESVLSFLIVLFLIVGTIVAFAEHRSKLWSYITNRRNKWYVAFACFMAAALILCLKKHWIVGTWMWAAAVIWAIYTIFTLLDLRPLDIHSFRNPILKRYKRYLREGTAYEHKAFFEKKHTFLQRIVFSAADRVEYGFLEHSYRIAVGDYSGAYKALQAIKDSTLYEAGKTEVRLRKAYCLAMMGSMTAARELLGKYEENQSKDPMVWIAYSFIFENAGDMNQAYEAAKKAKGLADISDLSEWEKGEVYNDFARAAIFHGNDEEALRYMNLAWEKVKGTKDNRLIHVMGGNYILRLALSGASRQECDKALEDYKSRVVHLEAPLNRMEYMNVLLQYYRQMGDETALLAAIKKGYKSILPKLEQKEVFRASVFRMLMNGHFEHKWFDKGVSKDYDAYKEMNLLDRLAAFREYIGIFTQEEFRAVVNHEPYKTLQKTILQYYKEDAIREIDEETAKTESYDVYRYKELMQHKLSILKHIQGKEHIDKSKDIYLQLSRALADAGLRIDAVNVLLILMDECSSPDNLLVATPLTPGWLYFSDFIKILPPVPDPILMADGIHLSYFRLNMPPFELKPLKDAVILEHLDPVIAEVKGWESHPAKIEFSVQLARFLMCFDRKDEARELFQIYESNKISDRQYASWLKEEIAALRAELGTSKKA